MRWRKSRWQPARRPSWRQDTRGQHRRRSFCRGDGRRHSGRRGHRRRRLEDGGAVLADPDIALEILVFDRDGELMGHAHFAATMRSRDPVDQPPHPAPSSPDLLPQGERDAPAKGSRRARGFARAMRKRPSPRLQGEDAGRQVRGMQARDTRSGIALIAPPAPETAADSRRRRASFRGNRSAPATARRR